MALLVFKRRASEQDWTIGDKSSSSSSPDTISTLNSNSDDPPPAKRRKIHYFEDDDDDDSDFCVSDSDSIKYRTSATDSSDEDWDESDEGPMEIKVRIKGSTFICKYYSFGIYSLFMFWFMFWFMIPYRQHAKGAGI